MHDEGQKLLNDYRNERERRLMPTLSLADIARPRSEDELHRQVADFFRSALRNDVLAFHVPNGGLRHKATAGRLRAMGVMAGVLDWQVIWERAHPAPRPMTLWIELKMPGRKPSEAQRTFIRRVQLLGHLAEVCHSIEEVEIALREHAVPLRARITA